MKDRTREDEIESGLEIITDVLGFGIPLKRRLLNSELEDKLVSISEKKRQLSKVIDEFFNLYATFNG